MRYLIGTDEAGYAPNLGPLVISATTWEIDDRIDDDRLYDALDDVVCVSPRDAHTARVAWADSKVLYSPGQGLAALERGMLAALCLIDATPADWRGLWRALDSDAAERLEAVPWHIGFNAELPLAADLADLGSLVAAIDSGCATAGARLVGIASKAVFPEEFNELVERHGNKAEVLSRLTLELIARSMDRLEMMPMRILCDKHGGRNRYGRLLQQQFCERLVEIREEGPIESAYAWGPDDARVEVRFRMGCESFLPVALASMASKYLREVAMLAFNRFWCQRLPELRPTAGYPTDAKRFKHQISALQSELGIDDGLLWRVR
ncbi:MAG TPA: hypothetical protein VG056_01900 [Pirellulales bacterium]|jgi:ribonuclease HII|nr:hypothetical protein [Pirellulales bacterium]